LRSNASLDPYQLSDKIAIEGFRPAQSAVFRRPPSHQLSLRPRQIATLMFDTAFVLLVITVLLVVVAVCQPLAARLKLPPPVLLGVVGVALGGFPVVLSKIGWGSGTDVLADAFAALPISSATFIDVFLPLLVFEAGVATDVRRVIEDAAPILLLAIVATLITTALIGLALSPIAGVPLVVCLLLGAVVSTTDPAAVIAIFRDVGAPGRLTRLVEGEALLNDAAAIALFAVVLGMIVAAREPDIGLGLREFFLSFAGGGLLGLLAGRALLAVIPWVGEDRLAEGTLTLALAYGVFIAADRLFHVSGVVAVLAAGLIVSALGRSRIVPNNWTFLSDLWDQIAFWARSLVFILASILVPRLLGHVDLHDLGLLAVLVGAAFAARILVLFGLIPPLEYLKLTQPISAAYKLAIAWGGLRGALTLVLALAVTGEWRTRSADPALCRRACHWVCAVHAVRQWRDIAGGHRFARARSAFAAQRSPARSHSRVVLQRGLRCRAPTGRRSQARAWCHR
jgi:CPA1 family monovalent cation:H+ antiporter